MSYGPYRWRSVLAHVRGVRQQGVMTEFSVGWAVTDREREAINRIPARAWTEALDADGGRRDGAAVAELTGLLPATTLHDYPAGTRILIRRERLSHRPAVKRRDIAVPRRVTVKLDEPLGARVLVETNGQPVTVVPMPLPEADV